MLYLITYTPSGNSGKTTGGGLGVGIKPASYTERFSIKGKEVGVITPGVVYPGPNTVKIGLVTGVTV
jgi:hypothetical protein